MAFDTLLALPHSIPDDLYLEHQAVWALVQQVAKHCTQFQYRIENSPTGVLVRLRTPNPVWGAVTVSLPASGAFELRIACARRADGKMIGVVDDTAFDRWFTARALRAGIAIQDLSFSSLRYIRGAKQRHQIAIQFEMFIAIFRCWIELRRRQHLRTALDAHDDLDAACWCLLAFLNGN